MNNNKERVAIPRVKMRELEAGYRSRSYDEVNLGLTLEQALREAQRCLDCPKPACITGCPVGVNIPKFIKHIERNELLEAAKTLKETSALPAVCGRVCPQEKQCESKCIHLKMKKEPVAVGYLERFAADFERESGSISIPKLAENNGIKIAVIGSGPAGLSFAGDMAKYGYDVTVFEALHEIGGVLKYGIPEFRLPNDIVDVEIDILRKMGVKFITNCIVGKTLSQEDLQQEGYQGIFIAGGAGLPNFMNIPGENLVGSPIVQRILDTCKPDGRQPGRNRYAGFLRKKGSHNRRRKYGDGLGSYSPTPGRRKGHDHLPPFGRGNARPRGRGETCKGRGYSLCKPS